jgi:septal ring factor EnvC (AmiA/AmiB activator)
MPGNTADRPCQHSCIDVEVHVHVQRRHDRPTASVQEQLDRIRRSLREVRQGINRRTVQSHQLGEEIAALTRDARSTLDQARRLADRTRRAT